MIVVCSTCQSRFKVADDKIGPRGAKVRCSKCQTVFVVHRDLGVLGAEPPAAAPPPPPPPAPAPPRPAGGIDLDLESEPMGGTRPSGFIADPFTRPAPPPGADPFAAAAPPAPRDPFAIPGPGFPGHALAQPPPVPAPSPSHDPFGGADPFGGHPPAPPPPAPSLDDQDPFGPPAAGTGAGLGAVDSFVATIAPPAGPSSAATDLSDLLGGAGPAATPPAPPPAPGVFDSGFDFAGPPEPDLALAERTPASPVPAQGAAGVPMPGFGDFAGADPFGEPAGASPGGALDLGGPPAGAHDFGGPDEDAFGAGPDLAEPSPPPAPHPPPRPPPSIPAPVLGGPAPAPAEPASPAPERPEAAAAEGLRHRTSRVRAVAINTLSLVALLAVVVVLLALWRGVRPGSGGLLHPGAFLGGAGPSRAQFEATGVRSGRYERADAPPLVFVAGTAVSHAAAPVRGLEVRVELVGRAGVLARGEARAGPVPGPEALHAARDPAALAAAYDGLAAAVPKSVKPGDAVPFLVAILDPPAEIDGVGLRVTVEPVSGDSPVPEAPPATQPPGDGGPPAPPGARATEGAAKP